MPRSEDEEIKRVHLWLFTRDLERLEIIAGGLVDRSKLVRTIVRQYLDSVDAKASLRSRRVEPTGDLIDSIEHPGTIDAAPADTD